ncbi:MAG: hypothetical protein C0507_19055 [Cyanobacteria bacterium PR.3.49]|nr:hypothetical protein [Cyanobacteria bacterium PR.3.49]
MISKVLVAVKDGHLMEVTEEFISGLQFTNTASIKALHVIEPVQTIGRNNSEETQEEASTLIESTCKRLTKRLSSRFASLNVTGCIRKGSINQEIVDEACSWGADLILMGPYGRAGGSKFLHASAATTHLPNSPCSVVLLYAKHAKHKNASSPALTQQ